MKIGAIYPQTELGGDPSAIGAVAKAYEALGCDHVVMYDHVVGAPHENRNPPLWEGGPYTEKHPFHDPFVAFGYMAAITKRIEFVTGVLVLPQRQTVLVAKQATDVDLLSGGRLRLGVGIGWNYIEYDALGQSFATRGARLAEQITYLRRLWSEEMFTFKGRFDSIDRACIIPRPKRQIPLYCGGLSEPAYKRAAKLADGFIFAGSVENTAAPGWTRIKELLVEEGRPLAEFGAHYLAQNDIGEGITVQETVDSIRRWEDLGGTHASILTMRIGYTELQQHIDHVSQALHLLGVKPIEEP